MKTLFKLTICVATLALGFGVFQPDASAKRCDYDLQSGVARAASGQVARFVCVDGHQFHVKPFTVVRGKPVGWISHVLRFRPDDQIRYHGMSYTINNGGFGLCKRIPGLKNGWCKRWLPALDRIIAYINKHYTR